MNFLTFVRYRVFSNRSRNSETGELDYLASDSAIFCKLEFDEETGEPSDEKYRVRFRKSKSFHIPNKYLKKSNSNEEQRRKIRTGPEPFTREDYINMDGVNNEILFGYNKANYRIFLIPTLFCFHMYTTIFFAFIEIFLHWWSHQRNGVNTNHEYYFRSPLHILTSQFCVQCRNESESDIFSHLNRQMRKAKFAFNFKKMSQAIS